MRAGSSRGNTLIVVTTSPESLPQTLRQDLTLPSPAEKPAELPSFLGQPSVDNRPETTQAPVKGGGSLTVEKKGPRWNTSSPDGPAPVASGGRSRRRRH